MILVRLVRIIMSSDIKYRQTKACRGYQLLLSKTCQACPKPQSQHKCPTTLLLQRQVASPAFPPRKSRHQLQRQTMQLIKVIWTHPFHKHDYQLLKFKALVMVSGFLIRASRLAPAQPVSVQEMKGTNTAPTTTTTTTTTGRR